MDTEVFRQNWGLFVALFLLLVVVLVGISGVIKRSSYGLLKSASKSLQAARRRRRSAGKSVIAAERKVARLSARAANTKPRLVEKAKGHLSDTRALAKIADDQFMIAANILRRVIFEEFPPNRHDQLRARYLPEDGPDGRPFTF